MPRPLRTALLALCLSGSACGWLAGELAEQKHRQDALEQQVYAGDVNKLWVELTPLWEAEGCKLPSPPPIGEPIECEANGDKKWLRVNKVGDGHKVQAEHEVERMDPDDPEKKIKERQRNFDLEWELLKNMDPDKAQSIEAEASQKGEKAKKAAKDLQEAFE